MTAPLFLAAGTVLDAAHVDQIRAAAAAGFDGCGLRLDPALLDAAGVTELARTAEREGVRILDVEVVRLGPDGPTDDDRRLVAIASELGARWVLAVSMTDDVDARRRGVETLVDVAQRNNVGIALEFMAFTAIRRLDDALATWSLVGGGLGVLVDALHLYRTGGTASQVAAMPPGSLAYAQLCDVAPGPTADDPAALADEARHHRLMPGDGVIDLGGFVAALPPTAPVTVEVQNDDLAARADAFARARTAMAAATRFVSRP